MIIAIMWMVNTVRRPFQPYKRTCPCFRIIINSIIKFISFSLLNSINFMSIFIDRNIVIIYLFYLIYIIFLPIEPYERINVFCYNLFLITEHAYVISFFNQNHFNLTKYNYS